MTTTRLLWTGGWDSPFRLSCLLLLQRRTVTPYYFLREKRPSTPIEIDTTAHIRQAFFAGMPTNARYECSQSAEPTPEH